MSSASLFEKEFMLESNRIMNEFELTNYIATTQWFAEGSLDGFNSLANCEDVPKFTEYINSMQSSLDDTISMTRDLSESLNTIANKIDFSKINMNVPDLVEDNISSINPAYLKQFALNFGKSLTAFCNSKGAYESGDFDRYMSSDTLDALKKQCVSVSGNEDESYTNRTAPDIKLTKNTLKSKYIKYVSASDKVYKELKDLSKDVCDVFNSVNYMIQSYKSTTCKVNEHRLASATTPVPMDDRNKISRLQQLVYNGTSIILQAASHISKMLGFKISTFVANMKIANDIRINLQNQSVNESTEHKSFFEEVMDTEFDNFEKEALVCDAAQGDYSLLNILLKTLIENHADHMMEIVSDVDMDGFIDSEAFITGFVSNYQHKKSGVYTIAESLIDNMEKHIEDLIMLSDKDLESVDAYAKEHPFKPWGMYGKDLAALDIPSTGSYKKEYAFLINELLHFSEDIEGVANKTKSFGYKLLRAYKDAEKVVKLDEMESEIADEIGVIYVNKENKKALLMYLKKYASDFDQFISDWVYSILNRFKAINVRLCELETADSRDEGVKTYINTFSNVTSMSASEYEFNEAMLVRELIDQQNSYDTIFESVVRESEKFRVFKESGLRLLYEDGETDDNSGLGNISDEEGDKGILHKIGSFFTNLWDTLSKTLLGKNKAQRNKNWLQAFKDAILNRDFDGVVIDILPYSEGENSQKVVTDIEKITNNINALQTTSQEISSIANENQLYNKLTNNVMTNINWENINPDQRSETVKQYFQIGNNKYDKVTISGEDVKRHVEGMINYCREFYDSYYQKIRKAFDNMKTACENKVRALGRASGGTGYVRASRQNNSNNNSGNNTANGSDNGGSTGNNGSGTNESVNWLLETFQYILESGDFDIDYFDIFFEEGEGDAPQDGSSDGEAPKSPDTTKSETAAEEYKRKMAEAKKNGSMDKAKEDVKSFRKQAFNVAKWMARFLTFFVKPCITAIDARNNDYLKTLDALNPNKNKEENPTNNTNTDDQNTQNQDVSQG